MLRYLTCFLILATAGAVAPEYFRTGFTHILPGGADHILFLLALFLVTQDFARLLFLLTLFTLSHSLAMGLSLHGIIDLPASFVEPAIALSIVAVAAEALRKKESPRIGPWVIFASGIVHGLGFAHSFGGDPPEKADFLPAMLSFNLGIECGQIVVIGIAWILAAPWWKRAWYPTFVARPAAFAIAASGLCWAALRMA